MLFATVLDNLDDLRIMILVGCPVGVYLLKVNNRNTRTRCERCLKSVIKTPVFIVNFEHISHFVLVFQLLTLNMQLPTGQSFISSKQTPLYCGD